jgi:hypothetical protein
LVDRRVGDRSKRKEKGGETRSSINLLPSQVSIFRDEDMKRREKKRREEKRREQNKTEEKRTEQNRTEENRREQNRREQNRTEENRTERTTQKRRSEDRKKRKKDLLRARTTRYIPQSPLSEVQLKAGSL